MRQLKTLKKLKEEIEASGLDVEIQRLCGYHLAPQFKRLVVIILDWDELPLSDGIILANYTADRQEKERGQGEMSSQLLQRCLVVACADDCREHLSPGMEVIIMPQTLFGYSTKMSWPNADDQPAGIQDYYTINEHDILSIIVEDRTVERKKTNIEKLKMLHEEEEARRQAKEEEEEKLNKKYEDLERDLAEKKKEAL